MDRVSVKDPQAVEKAVMVLDEAGLVMHPTDTCYGFAVDVFHEDALRKLYFVKDMKDDKPLSIMVADLEMAQEYGDFSPKALELAEKYWPGPLSIMVPRKDSLPAYFNKGHDFVSIRVADSDFCQGMLSHLGEPVTTTSANKSGQPPLYVPEVMGGVDLIVDGGPLKSKKPSTIVKVDGDSVEIIRQGDLEI